jgi:hypothetical protein
MRAAIKPFQAETVIQRLSALEAEAASTDSDERRTLLNQKIDLVRELLEIAQCQQSRRAQAS